MEQEDNLEYVASNLLSKEEHILNFKVLILCPRNVNIFSIP